MAGQARYTNYAPVQKDQSIGGSSPPTLGRANYVLLRSLFGSRPDVLPLTNDPAAIKPVLDRANQYLNPPIQDQADPTWFPEGVYLNFLNPLLSAPDVPNIDVSTLGDGGPSNPWTPNLSSTDPSGKGSTEPVPAVLIPHEQIQPNLVIGADNGTADPAQTAQTMFAGSQLPSTLTPGFRPGRTLPER